MADPLVGKVLADRFEILERIGEGGTGVVYKAKQTAIDRIVAIKVLGAHVSTDPSWVKRFHNEARAAAKLDHPNTVRVIDFGQTKEGLLFIAMELLQGRSVRDEIDRVGKMPPLRALKIISQACQSLSEAHAHGIIHRDIKPDNLYLCDVKGGVDFVKVLDFSVAKLTDAGTQQTRAGVVFGTPCYMSPEQGRGGQLAAQSDIYALGIVLYEMLSGKPPFESNIPTEVVMMHIRDQPPPLQGVPEQVSAIVMKALSKEPSQRQKSCDEMAEECDAVAATLTGPRATGGYGAARMPTGSMRPVSVAAPRHTPAPMAAAGSEQKTMMPTPGQLAQLGNKVPPVANPPAELKTMMGDAGMLQNLPHAAAPPSVVAADGYDAPAGPRAGQQAPGGTMMLPDSAGVLSFASQRVQAARNAVVQGPPPKAKPAGALFWTSWIVLGLGLGLGVHFMRLFLSH